ncbi:hypothetical protein J4417_05155 [Candidatus Woesearchaeota archaeon]|nr:hypothetical protein [Candidatus Woesearchaeota archaeon]
MADGTNERGIREIVEEELKTAKIVGPKIGWLSEYLNNFHTRLPGGFYRGRSFDYFLDKKYTNENASKKLKGMTHAEFYKDIDTTIAELGLNPEQIERLVRSYSLTKLSEIVLPVYIRLREAGYNHQDLVG